MAEDTTPRWQYRFENYTRAYLLLKEACERYQRGELEQLAKEGMVQRFEVCLELAWKTMKDYMEYQGVVFERIFPAVVLREAAATKLIDRADRWLEALDSRTITSHTDDLDQFESIVADISDHYLDQCFSALYASLLPEAEHS